MKTENVSVQKVFRWDQIICVWSVKFQAAKLALQQTPKYVKNVKTATLILLMVSVFVHRNIINQILQESVAIVL